MGRAGSECVAERFGENLRRVRRREGLSQEQLAIRASLHRSGSWSAPGASAASTP
jgi:transcriptional regulator with XRE-family HTH domain